MGAKVSDQHGHCGLRRAFRDKPSIIRRCDQSCRCNGDHLSHLSAARARIFDALVLDDHQKDKDPTKVPSRAGVNIQWDHLDADGKYDSAASLTAAKAMVGSYGMLNLEVPPALNSRHTMKLAVDMSISWSGDLSINDKEGKAVVIKSEPRTGMNADLKSVGATYGVLKFVGGAADKPHWSDNGH
ncbi:hypothetical protein [Aquabacterium sp.]|uniref:hypothetical protein n=1 Tax=Aquabacterium sp. TaxID=1872578 RepID=UPI003D6D1E9E